MDTIITGDLIKCRATGSMGVVTQVGARHIHNRYKILWFDTASMTYQGRVDIEQVPLDEKTE